MGTRVWLFPFSHGVDASAIEQVMHLAAAAGAELCAVALHTVTHGTAEQGVRLESTMQANDFFEVVQYKAEQHNVRVRYQQVYTQDMVQSVKQLAEKLGSSSVVVVLHGQKSLLLETSAVKELLQQSAVPLMLVRPLEQSSQSGGPVEMLRSWWQRRRQVQETAVSSTQATPERAGVAVASEALPAQEVAQSSAHI